ncbi:MAG: hypothetical protein HFJ41_08480 [Clostridia bacterium]|nr:hypothetical protein [Clostridia bacterium]
MNVRDNFLTQIKKAASQYAVYGDPQALADIISQVQQENNNEGYVHAVEVLQDNNSYDNGRKIL